MINIFHIVSNKIWSGPEQYAYDLMLKLKDQDEYYVEMVCGKSDTVLNRFRPLEIPISILPLKGITDLGSPKRFKQMCIRDRFRFILYLSGKSKSEVTSTSAGKIARPLSPRSSQMKLIYTFFGFIDFTSS